MKTKPIKGVSNFDFTISGKILRVDNISDACGKCFNKIIVLKYASSECVLLFNEVAGIICENGGSMCHLSILSFEMGVPCVLGVVEASTLVSGQDVSITSVGGEALIYEN